MFFNDSHSSVPLQNKTQSLGNHSSSAYKEEMVGSDYEGGGLFCIFDAIGAMVLLISSKQIKLESCACAQIEAFEV